MLGFCASCHDVLECVSQKEELYCGACARLRKIAKLRREKR